LHAVCISRNRQKKHSAERERDAGAQKQPREIVASHLESLRKTTKTGGTLGAPARVILGYLETYTRIMHECALIVKQNIISRSIVFGTAPAVRRHVSFTPLH
jgi:uncharacterized protein (DUF2342 family)